MRTIMQSTCNGWLSRHFTHISIILFIFICSIEAQQISIKGAKSSTVVQFDTTAIEYSTISIAFSGQVKDRWLPQVGPLNLVPTDCVPTASQTGCLGGAGKFSAMLQAVRKESAKQNRTTLFLLNGDWLNGNSFGRAPEGRGRYEASYMYLLAPDATGLAAYEYHPELGANFTTFLYYLDENFAGRGVPGGMADLMIRTDNGTIVRGTSRRLMAARGSMDASSSSNEHESFDGEEKQPEEGHHQFHTEAVYVAPVPPAHFPLIFTNVRVRTPATQTAVFSILDPFAATLPKIQSSVILDAGLDVTARNRGVCSDATSSCSYSVTGGWGYHTIEAEGGPSASSSSSGDNRNKIGILTWTTEDLTQLSTVSSLYPDIEDLIYQDQLHSTELLQKEVSALLDGGVNKIILLSPSKMIPSFEILLKSIVGIDVVLYQSSDVYPVYSTSQTISGAPILFLGCSPFLLTFCLAEVKFDVNGVLIGMRFNTTLLDGTIDGSQTIVHKTIVTDYKSIFVNSSTSVVGYKQYPPAYPKDTSRIRFVETEDGSVCADSGRWIGRSQIGWCNSGSVRTILPQGPILLNSIATFLPFENNWVKLRVSGALLWSSMENSVSLSSISNSSDPTYSTSGRGKFCQLSGMRARWNPLAPVGRKISSIEILRTPSSSDPMYDKQFNLDTQKPGINTAEEQSILNNLQWDMIDPDQKYTLTIPSFEAANGDGYFFQGHPESEIIDGSLNTFQVVFQSFLSKYNPIKVTVEQRIVIDKTKYAPSITSIDPNTGELHQTNILQIRGFNLYTGSDASKTRVWFRSKDYNVTIPCVVQVAPASSTTLGVGEQVISCITDPASEDVDPRVSGVRVFIDSGADGAMSFSSLTPPIFNFTLGSASENCARYEGTLFQSSTQKCICRAGYEAADLSSSSNHHSLCQPCQAGYFSLDGDGHCTPCPVGRSSSEPKSSSCVECPSDTFASTPGSTVCTSCPTNSITDLNLSPEKVRVRCYCASGYIPTEDLRRVVERARGIYIDYSTQSDNHTTTSISGDSPYGPASFYPSNFSCTLCPDGGLCDRISGELRVLPGRWFNPETAQFLYCPNAENCCPEGSILQGSNFGEEPSCSLVSDEVACDAHREGFLCASCEQGYQNQLRSVLAGASSSSSSSSSSTSSSTLNSNNALAEQGSPTICVACEKPNGGILALLAFIGLVYLTFVMLNTPGKSDYTKILIDFYQMCALVLLPNMLSAGNSDASYFQLFHLRVDIAVGSSSADGTCIVPISSLANMVLHAIIGPLLLGSLMVLVFVCWLTTLCVPSIRPTFPWWRFRMASWQLLLFGFMGTISGAFNLLHCKTIGGRSLLVESPDVECWKGSHTIVATLSIIVVVLLVLIVPVGIVMFVRRLRLRLKSAFLFEQLKAGADAATTGGEHTTATAAGEQVVDVDTQPGAGEPGSPRPNARVTPSQRQRELTAPLSPSQMEFGFAGSSNQHPPAPRTPQMRARSDSSFTQQDSVSGSSVPVSQSYSNASRPHPEKLDMERVARRIYRKSGIVSMMRRGSAMLSAPKGSFNAGATSPPRSPLAAPRSSLSPVKTPFFPEVGGASSASPGPDAGLTDMVGLSPQGVMTNAPDQLASRALDDYGNPLARFKYYADSAGTDSKITVAELVRDAELELTPFENLLLSHGILFLAYKRGWRWFEGAFLIRRVLFALPYALTDQQTAIIISGWFCSLNFLFHSMVDVFAMPSTHRLHNASLICVISLCWLQATPSFHGVWIHWIAWLLVLCPFILAATTHPWTGLCRRACKTHCCCCLKCLDQKDSEAEAARVEALARKKVARRNSLTGQSSFAGVDSLSPPSNKRRLNSLESGSALSSVRSDRPPRVAVNGGVDVKAPSNREDELALPTIAIDPDEQSNSDLRAQPPGEAEKQQLQAVTAQWHDAVLTPVAPPKIGRSSGGHKSSSLPRVARSSTADIAPPTGVVSPKDVAVDVFSSDLAAAVAEPAAPTVVTNAPLIPVGGSPNRAPFQHPSTAQSVAVHVSLDTFSPPPPDRVSSDAAPVPSSPSDAPANAPSSPSQMTLSPSSGRPQRVRIRVTPRTQPLLNRTTESVSPPPTESPSDVHVTSHRL